MTIEAQKPLARTMRAVFTAAALMGVAALSMGGAGCASNGTEAATPAAGTGSPAPELSAAYVTGEGPKTLADAKGKVVIVDFWATYCGPCKKSFPKYQELLDQFGGDLVVIAVSVDEPDAASEEKLKEFATETQVKFSILWDKDHKTADLYKPSNMPTSYIIDRDGKIAHVHAKYEGGEEAKIADEIKALLGK